MQPLIFVLLNQFTIWLISDDRSEITWKCKIFYAWLVFISQLLFLLSIFADYIQVKPSIIRNLRNIASLCLFCLQLWNETYANFHTNHQNVLLRKIVCEFHLIEWFSTFLLMLQHSTKIQNVKWIWWKGYENFKAEMQY